MNMPKTIVIFGATGGIGISIVRKLATGQNKLIIVSKNPSNLQALFDEIKNLGCDTVQYTIDLENQSNYTEFCNNLTKDTSVDWIIHCGGYIGESNSFSEELNISDLRKTFEINFFAPFYITQFFASKIKAGGIIFVTSTASLGGNGFFPSYASSKSALTNLAQSLALHWKNTVNRSIIICPGPTNTTMREKVAGDSELHQSPQEIANLLDEVMRNDREYKNGSYLVINKGEIRKL